MSQINVPTCDIVAPAKPGSSEGKISYKKETGLLFWSSLVPANILALPNI